MLISVAYFDNFHAYYNNFPTYLHAYFELSTLHIIWTQLMTNNSESK